jgi:hypothetical protein
VPRINNEAAIHFFMVFFPSNERLAI